MSDDKEWTFDDGPTDPQSVTISYWTRFRTGITPGTEVMLPKLPMPITNEAGAATGTSVVEFERRGDELWGRIEGAHTIPLVPPCLLEPELVDGLPVLNSERLKVQQALATSLEEADSAVRDMIVKAFGAGSDMDPYMDPKLAAAEMAMRCSSPREPGPYEAKSALVGPWFSAEDMAEIREPRVPLPGEPEPEIVVGVDPAGGGSVTMALHTDGTREILSVDLPEPLPRPTWNGMPFPEGQISLDRLRPDPANPRKIDAILSAGAGLVLSPVQLESLRARHDEIMLRTKLEGLARALPGLGPSVAEVLRYADSATEEEASTSFKLDMLTSGYERILAGQEFVDGVWTQPIVFNADVAQQIQEILRKLASSGRDGAVETAELAEQFKRIEKKTRLEGIAPDPPRPNRHERRKRAALDRRAK